METPAIPPATQSVVFCRNGFSLYQYGGLVRPHLMLNQMVQYNTLMNTAVIHSLPALFSTTPCSFLLVSEDSESLVVFIPLPKWRKKLLSYEVLQVSIRLRGSRLCYRAGGEDTQYACA